VSFDEPPLPQRSVMPVPKEAMAWPRSGVTPRASRAWSANRSARPCVTRATRRVTIAAPVVGEWSRALAGPELVVAVVADAPVDASRNSCPPRRPFCWPRWPACRTLLVSGQPSGHWHCRTTRGHTSRCREYLAPSRPDQASSVRRATGLAKLLVRGGLRR
jgi:hypothetical protein